MKAERPRFDFWYDHDPFDDDPSREDRLKQARAERDIGMAKALKAEHEAWKGRALLIALTIDEGWVGLFEEVRIMIVKAGHPQPHVPQVWGGLCSSWIAKGYFVRVNEGGQPVSKQSHASRYWKIMRVSLPS